MSRREFIGRRAVEFSVFLCVTFALIGVAAAYERNPRTIFCPIVKKAPAIDGAIGEEEWSGSQTISTLVDHVSKGEVKDTVVRVMADSSRLYVAFECGGPDAKPEEAKEHARDEASTSDDAVMVMLDMNHDNKTSKVFLVDYLGAQRDGANRYPDIGGLGKVSWNAEWKSAVSRGEESWSVEMAIPVEEISGEEIAAGRTVGVNFGRSRPGLGTRSYLTFGGGGFRPPWYGDMVFGRSSVALSEIAMPAWRQGMNKVRLKFRNYGGTHADVEVKVKTIFAWSEEGWKAEALSLAAGEEASVELEGRAFGDSGNRFELEVYEKGSERKLYSASYQFATEDAVDEEGTPWRSVTSGTVCFQPELFKVSLSRTTMPLQDRDFRVRTELRSEAAAWEVVGGGEYEQAPRTDGVMEVAAQTEGLVDGRYEFWVTVTSPGGTMMVRTAHSFVCAGKEFGGVKESLESLGKSAEKFEKERVARGLARSSALLLWYYVEEAKRQMKSGTVEDFRERLAACEKEVEKAKGLAEAFGQRVDPLKDKKGLVERAFVSPYDGHVRLYKVFIPSAYDPSERFPLIAHLLAEGPDREKEWLPGVKALWEHTLKRLEEKGFMAVWPSQTRRLEAEVNFFAVLEEMKRDYNVDEERVYLMGVSGGGLSSWLIGLQHPDQIAAIAPISAVSVANMATENPTGDRGTVDTLRSVYYFPMNALHVPVIVLHGDADPVTPVDVQARPMVEKMRELGLGVEYHEYPGAAHGLGEDYLDAFDKIIDFFSRHRNVRYPKTIDFTTFSLRYNKAYWIWIERFADPGEPGRVKAKVEDNVIRIETENVASLSLVPRPEVLDLRSPVKVIIDGQEVTERKVPLKRGHSGPWMRFGRDKEGRWH